MGETSATAFKVAPSSLAYWEERLSRAGIPAERLGKRFACDVLRFADPDGLRLELIADAQQPVVYCPRTSDVPVEHSIHGFSGVTLCVAGHEMTAAVLEKMGFRKSGEEENRCRFTAPGHALGNYIDLLVQPQLAHGRMGAGSVHHIAFRAPDDQAQQAWRDELKAFPLDVTPVLDRTYFHSIYFREPGGVLFEIATDPPGFSLDEPVEHLGEALKLPPWLDARRKVVEASLPLITFHDQGKN